MKFTTFTINQNGLDQIRSALTAKHKQAEFTDEMVLAWAETVTDNLAEGIGAQAEIRASDSATGHVEFISVSSAGYDVGEADAE